MYLAFKNLKLSSKIDQQWSEIEKQTRILFFQVEMQQDKWRWWNYNLNCTKGRK